MLKTALLETALLKTTLLKIALLLKVSLLLEAALLEGPLLEDALLLRMPLHVQVQHLFRLLRIENTAGLPAPWTASRPQTRDHTIGHKIPIVQTAFVQRVLPRVLQELLLLGCVQLHEALSKLPLPARRHATPLRDLGGDTVSLEHQPGTVRAT